MRRASSGCCTTAGREWLVRRPGRSAGGPVEGADAVATSLATPLFGAGFGPARLIGRGLPQAASPAKLGSSLNLSQPTLRRHLVEAGLGYRAMRHELRKSRAVTLVLGGPMDLAAVAIETGFADLSHFGRVLARATGQTPTQTRNHVT